MFMKKALLASLSVVVMSASATAMADASLQVINKSNKDSSVLIHTSRGDVCSGPSNYTPAGGSSNTPAVLVSAFCAGAVGNICKTTMYDSRDCSGTQVAEADINLGTFTVAVTPLSPAYTVTSYGNAVVEISNK